MDLFERLQSFDLGRDHVLLYLLKATMRGDDMPGSTAVFAEADID